MGGGGVGGRGLRGGERGRGVAEEGGTRTHFVSDTATKQYHTTCRINRFSHTTLLLASKAVHSLTHSLTHWLDPCTLFTGNVCVLAKST